MGCVYRFLYLYCYFLINYIKWCRLLSLSQVCLLRWDLREDQSYATRAINIPRLDMLDVSQKILIFIYANKPLYLTISIRGTPLITLFKPA